MKLLLTILLFPLLTHCQTVVTIQGRQVTIAPGVQTAITKFHLDTSTVTSVGINKSSDSSLVRTLWSNVRKPAGDVQIFWDGFNDTGAVAPNTSYYITILKNNVVYSWDGARIGNTSTAFTGGTIHRASDAPLSLCVGGSNLYYASGYQERYVANFVTSLSNIGARDRVNGGGNNVAPMSVCSDGTTVFWGVYSASGQPFTFVYATKVSDGTVKTFTNGVSQATSDQSYPSTISYRAYQAGVSDIQSMAVQRTGSKLFVSRNNEIKVYNKNTGDSLNIITVSGRPILNTDTSGNLWVGVGSSIIKYTVNSNGSLTSTGISVTGITSVGAIAVSPDNLTVAVADQDTAQQVINFFSNQSGGSATNTLGTAGGYMNDASVTDYKFYFNDVRTYYPTSIAYQSDGSFWVIDGGNSRMQHYSSSRTFLNRIMYMPTGYVVQVDPNNSNRVFDLWGGGSDPQAGYLEFYIDYSKDLVNNQAGAWTLAKNWGARINSTYDYFRKMQNIVTISGHTFGVLSGNSSNYDVYELVAGGVVRKTKVVFSVRMAIGKDGTKYWNPSGNVVGSQSAIYKYAYTGLDTDNDPTWSGTQQTVVTTPIISTNTPQLLDNFKENITSSGKWIFFDPQYYPTTTGTDPHLGAIPVNGTDYLWRTSFGTSGNYTGDFPANGMFDNGNGVGQGINYQGGAGGYSVVNGRNIIWTYHGEFWKTSQTNMFNHYLDNGLMIGQFGTLRTDYGDAESVYGGAGNAIYGSWVQYSNDVAYLYSGDEGVNAGVQRWKISGLSTVSVQTIPLDLTRNSPVTSSAIDLLSTLSGKGYLTATATWTANDYTPVNSTNIWLPQLGGKTPEIFTGGQDIYAFHFNPTAAHDINCNLGTNTVSPWSIEGKITWSQNVPQSNGNSDGSYVFIYDNANKAIAKIEEYSPDNGSTFQIRLNGVVVYSLNGTNDQKSAVFAKNQPFALSVSGSTITLSYAGSSASAAIFDNTANIQNPKRLNMHFDAGNHNRGIGLSELEFYR